MDKLKYLRLKNNYTMQNIADYLEINKSSYYKKESGSIKISLEEAKKLSDLYACSIEYIFFYK